MFVDICGYFDSSGTKNNKCRLPYGEKVLVHWIQTVAVAPAQFIVTFLIP